MLYLVIFSSLAAAMAIVAQGNLTTADTHMRAARATATSETGIRYVIYQVAQAASTVTTRDGIIDDTNAPALWIAVRDAMVAAMANNPHNQAEPSVSGGVLTIGPIAPANGEPPFTATLTPHPLAGENYDSSYYQRPPFSTMNPAVSSSTPLDTTWVRVRVTTTDGSISRSVQVDFQIDKKIPFALLSKSRIMIGRHVMIDGPVGSRFTETSLVNGHPIQMQTDFVGLDSALDANLAALIATLNTNDVDGDNRIRVTDATETNGITNPSLLDINGDSYIDDYDYFLDAFDSNGDNAVTDIELDTAGNINAAQLLQLIDTFGDPTRAGYNDGRIDDDDRYAKVRGQIDLAADMAGWSAGAAGGNIQQYYRGPVHADFGEQPLEFASSEVSQHNYTPADFDVSAFAAMATGDLQSQAETQAATHDPADPESPQPLDQTSFEEAPFGSPHPYDYFDRPVYENMTFTNVTIPRGSNALFRNCTFIGATFVDTEAANVDANYNYAGMIGADGTPLYPGTLAVVNGNPVSDTKTISNNLRFDGCTFEGAVISAVPQAFSHVRNKIAFTGQTQFNIDGSTSLTASEKTLFKRSTILAPHYSVEMGTFIDPTSSAETVNLSGTIVAGVFDIRGQVTINGTVLTTFEAVSSQSPVLGATSPQFNTTLGYFSSAEGDHEAELPATGVGVIQLTYDDDMPLPDGILGPIQVKPVMATYFEGG